MVGGWSPCNAVFLEKKDELHIDGETYSKVKHLSGIKNLSCGKVEGIPSSKAKAVIRVACQMYLSYYWVNNSEIGLEVSLGMVLSLINACIGPIPLVIEWCKTLFEKTQIVFWCLVTVSVNKCVLQIVHGEEFWVLGQNP